MDIAEIIGYGVMSTPGVVVDDPGPRRAPSAQRCGELDDTPRVDLAAMIVPDPQRR